MTEQTSTMEIVCKDQTSLREEYSKLVLEKEFLVSHRSLQLKSDYMLKVGAKELAVYKKNIELMRAKRKLTLIRQYTNRSKTPDIKEIERTIEKEFSEYSKRIEEQTKQIDALLKISNTEKLSAEESAELKSMYKRIVRSLHPDLNPSVDEKGLDKYRLAVEAYHKGDIACIRAIFWTLADDRNDIPYVSNMEEKIIMIKEEISRIKKIFPFDKIDFLEDREAIKRRNDELDDLMKIYSEELTNVNKMIDDLEYRL